MTPISKLKEIYQLIKVAQENKKSKKNAGVTGIFYNLQDFKTLLFLRFIVELKAFERRAYDFTHVNHVFARAERSCDFIACSLEVSF